MFLNFLSVQYILQGQNLFDKLAKKVLLLWQLVIGLIFMPTRNNCKCFVGLAIRLQGIVVRYAAWKDLFFHGYSRSGMSLVNHHCLWSRLRMSREIPLLSVCLYGVPWNNITCTSTSTDHLTTLSASFTVPSTQQLTEHRLKILRKDV
jgi:hypothetical protein